MSKKPIIIGAVVLIVIVAIIGFYFFSTSEPSEKCGTPISDHNITLLYDGEPISGQYYWFNTIDNWLSVEKIEDSNFEIYVLGDEIERGIDPNLKIVKLDRNDDLNHNEIFNLNYVTNNDPNYERGKSEITKERILQDVRSYSIGEPEYFEIKNVFSTEVYNHHNIVVDLKTGEIVSHNKFPDEELWMYCDY